MSEQQHRTGGGKRIGPDTTLTIASALSVATVVVVATWKMSGTMANLDSTLRTLSKQAWTITDQERFANKLERLNPPLTVPDTLEILRNRPSETADPGLAWPKSGSLMMWDGATWEADHTLPPEPSPPQ